MSAKVIECDVALIVEPVGYGDKRWPVSEPAAVAILALRPGCSLWGPLSRDLVGAPAGSRGLGRATISGSTGVNGNCGKSRSGVLKLAARTSRENADERPLLGVVRQMAEVSALSSRQRWTLVLVCTATFMLLLDITVVSVALPSIQRDLQASLADLQWVIDAYALVLAVLLLPAATLGDRVGRRRLFLTGLAVFTAGSLACALAPTALALELFRALQGVGGAVLFATGTPLLRAEFSGAALARALGAFGATIGGATAIGPLAGGVLTDTLGWRSIFFINLPIGVAAFAGGVARLRESRDPAGGRADWVGTALITAALTALIFALIRGNALGWASPAIVALFATAAVAFAAFVIYELRIAAAPMADLRLFGRRSFAATGFVAFAISATVIGMISFLSLYIQNTLGYSPVQAGLRSLPLSLASFAVALLTGRLIGTVAMRVLLGVAMVAAAAGLASMAHLTATSTWLVLLSGLILAGIG